MAFTSLFFIDDGYEYDYSLLVKLKPVVANFQRHVSPWRVIGRVCAQKPTLLMTDFVHRPYAYTADNLLMR